MGTLQNLSKPQAFANVRKLQERVKGPWLPASDILSAMTGEAMTKSNTTPCGLPVQG